MKNFRRLAFLLSVALPVVLPTTAAAAPVKLLGLDDMACPTWSATKNDPEQRQNYIAWLRGFLSGHNYASQSRQVAVVSNGTLALYIDRYCSEKPGASVADAVMRMSDDYSGRNAPITK